MKIKSSFSAIVLTAAFRKMAFGFLGLFSPIYIFQIIINNANGENTLKFAVLGVLFYMLAFYLVKLLTFPLSENLSYKLGFKNVIALYIFPLLLYVSCLVLAKDNLLFLFLAPLFGGMQAALFWFGYHGLFIKCVNEHSFGFREGICNGISILALIITPLLGSILILAWGFRGLFFTAAILSLISALIILFSPQDKPYRDVRFLKVFSLFKSNLRPFGAYLGHGGEFSIYGTVWPIFLILALGNILEYGGIISGGILLAFLVTLAVGRWVDRAKGKRIITIGALVGGFSWLLRIVIRLPLFIVGVEGFYRITEQMLSIPMDVESYKKALRGWVSHALYFREISLSLGAILAISGSIILIALNLPLWSPFFLAFLGNLAPILMRKELG